MSKTIFEQLTSYRVKVTKDGRDLVNVPGILALPAALFAPKAGIIGMIAAPLLGCSVHLENEDGQGIDVGKAVKDAANTVVETATSAAKTVRETIEKAWNDLSADDPEGCPVGEENAEDPAPAGQDATEAEAAPADENIAEAEAAPADQDSAAKEVPTIRVNPEETETEKSND